MADIKGRLQVARNYMAICQRRNYRPEWGRMLAGYATLLGKWEALL